jgi:hypothetical protein
VGVVVRLVLVAGVVAVVAVAVERLLRAARLPMHSNSSRPPTTTRARPWRRARDAL